MPPNSNNIPPGPANTPGVYGPGNRSFSGGAKSRKLPIIIVAVVVFIFVVLIILAVLLSNRQTPNTEPDTETPSSVEPEGPQPATSLDVENTANSITQDISNLNDEEDLPKDQLSDENLEL